MADMEDPSPADQPAHASAGGHREPRCARRILLAVAATAVVGGIVVITQRLPAPRTTPIFDPSVLAGRPLWGSCGGGFHARRGETVVVTSSGHCATEGTVAYEADGRTVRGVFGPSAVERACDQPGHTCKPSDMNYLVIAQERIPWGRLNLVDMGVGGYRELGPGTRPLACADIAVGDPLEINGRDLFRAGVVAEKGPYVHDPALDGDAFACMVAARIPVAVGDSGSAVLVRGLPAGVVSRSFGGVLGVVGSMGFTPLAEGLTSLGLELCTTPNCGLTPSST
jgi:hypothetical protein